MCYSLRELAVTANSSELLVARLLASEGPGTDGEIKRLLATESTEGHGKEDK